MITPLRGPRAHHSAAHNCTSHLPRTKTRQQPTHLPPPRNIRGQPRGCCSTTWLSRRLAREQCTQVRYQATRAVQMSEPMTFKNSTAVILGKAWERGRKAQHSHSNRSSICQRERVMWICGFSVFRAFVT